MGAAVSRDGRVVGVGGCGMAARRWRLIVGIQVRAAVIPATHPTTFPESSPFVWSRVVVFVCLGCVHSAAGGTVAGDSVPALYEICVYYLIPGFSSLMP